MNLKKKCSLILLVSVVTIGTVFAQSNIQVYILNRPQCKIILSNPTKTTIKVLVEGIFDRHVQTNLKDPRAKQALSNAGRDIPNREVFDVPPGSHEFFMPPPGSPSSTVRFTLKNITIITELPGNETVPKEPSRERRPENHRY